MLTVPLSLPDFRHLRPVQARRENGRPGPRCCWSARCQRHCLSSWVSSPPLTPCWAGPATPYVDICETRHCPHPEMLPSCPGALSSKHTRHELGSPCPVLQGEAALLPAFLPRPLSNTWAP